MATRRKLTVRYETTVQIAAGGVLDQLWPALWPWLAFFLRARFDT
ncbi:hypothetical protein ACFOZ0_12185 [Streptomyces yaanensis]|uniref:Uncharacterized protein n=1 Tax=Streptomyces yaanensis TaxID=1142239 RepID=A0ABV7SBY6_9ACTN|nr:hypothetical protein [Streptomyces sp. CGMCC 4.7035]WNB99114.1 hypothetical protein Q2K21_14110 [Streptomyces sp. CGMCC 4.7035]